MAQSEFIWQLPITRQIGDDTRLDHLTLVQDEQAGFTLVDTGFAESAALILAELQKLGVEAGQISNIVLTHADRDHAGSAKELHELTGATLWASEREAPYITGQKLHYKPLSAQVLAELPADFAALVRDGIPSVPIQNHLVPGQRLPFMRNALVIATPGHSPGHVSLYFEQEKILISGDA